MSTPPVVTPPAAPAREAAVALPTSQDLAQVSRTPNPAASPTMRPVDQPDAAQEEQAPETALPVVAPATEQQLLDDTPVRNPTVQRDKHTDIDLQYAAESSSANDGHDPSEPATTLSTCSPKPSSRPVSPLAAILDVLDKVINDDLFRADDPEIAQNVSSLHGNISAHVTGDVQAEGDLPLSENTTAPTQAASTPRNRDASPLPEDDPEDSPPVAPSTARTRKGTARKVTKSKTHDEDFVPEGSASPPSKKRKRRARDEDNVDDFIVKDTATDDKPSGTPSFRDESYERRITFPDKSHMPGFTSKTEAPMAKKIKMSRTATVDSWIMKPAEQQSFAQRVSLGANLPVAFKTRAAGANTNTFSARRLGLDAGNVSNLPLSVEVKVSEDDPNVRTVKYKAGTKYLAIDASHRVLIENIVKTPYNYPQVELDPEERVAVIRKVPYDAMGDMVKAAKEQYDQMKKGDKKLEKMRKKATGRGSASTNKVTKRSKKTSTRVAHRA
ncbi:hypothetical protein BDV95DRAFT_589801 [Massariosphaeria phaeospora]|uniref:Uncharacterized protein n=1 Tax=Massariosphaeria phaeospora TaxID=100035 RepID=A0A7C8MUD0_9PLEO|nr:hypothetical protein BDV95DRAFT_589801 [Massariosphaeria phaeospora]